MSTLTILPATTRSPHTFPHQSQRPQTPLAQPRQTHSPPLTTPHPHHRPGQHSAYQKGSIQELIQTSSGIESHWLPFTTNRSIPGGATVCTDPISHYPPLLTTHQSRRSSDASSSGGFSTTSSLVSIISPDMGSHEKSTNTPPTTSAQKPQTLLEEMVESKSGEILHYSYSSLSDPACPGSLATFPTQPLPESLLAFSQSGSSARRRSSDASASGLDLSGTPHSSLETSRRLSDSYPPSTTLGSPRRGSGEASPYPHTQNTIDLLPATNVASLSPLAAADKQSVHSDDITEKSDPSVSMIRDSSGLSGFIINGVHYGIAQRLSPGRVDNNRILYVAYDLSNNSFCVIKRQIGSGLNKGGIESLRREVKNIQDLRKYPHKNILPILVSEMLEDGLRPSSFLVMPFKATSLDDLLKSSPLTLSELKSLIIQILEGLAHFHRNGFVHRDIKSSNVLIDQTEDTRTALLADFGSLRGRNDYADPTRKDRTPAYHVIEDTLRDVTQEEIERNYPREEIRRICRRMDMAAFGMLIEDATRSRDKISESEFSDIPDECRDWVPERDWAPERDRILHLDLTEARILTFLDHKDRTHKELNPLIARLVLGQLTAEEALLDPVLAG